MPLHTPVTEVVEPLTNIRCCRAMPQQIHLTIVLPLRVLSGPTLLRRQTTCAALAPHSIKCGPRPRQIKLDNESLGEKSLKPSNLVLLTPLDKELSDEEKLRVIEIARTMVVAPA